MTLDAAALREFLRVKGRVDMSKIENDTPLFTSGNVESFTMIDLVFFIEESCATKLEPSEVRLDHLDSIDRILAFLAERNATAEGGA